MRKGQHKEPKLRRYAGKLGSAEIRVLGPGSWDRGALRVDGAAVLGSMAATGSKSGPSNPKVAIWWLALCPFGRSNHKPLCGREASS